jgi:C1A family cysteine protease
MKTSIIIALIGVIAVTFLMSSSPATSKLETDFNRFMAEYKKSYNTEAEYYMRLAIFDENVKLIETHNSGDSLFTMGVNNFVDWTNEEYRSMLGYRKATFPKVPVNTIDIQIADTVDWVKKGAVTRVKNQGQCGSCWAFGTIGAVEGAHFVKHGELLNFSVQELVDCCHESCDGCDGGFQNHALHWLESHKLCKATAYPYTAKDGTCHEEFCDKANVEVKDFVVLDTSALALEQALNIVPVSVTVDAGSIEWQLYSEGVFDSIN